MRKTALLIVLCAAVLLFLCVFCRFAFFHTMDVYLPTYLAKEGSFEKSGLRLTVQDPEILRVGKTEMYDNYLKVTVVPGLAGETEMDLAGPDGQEQSCYIFRVDALKTVYDVQTGGFTGDGAVLAALAAFWFLAGGLMLRQYLQTRGPAYYAYSTIYSIGFFIFALATGATMLIVSVLHITRPEAYSMSSAYGMINGAPMQFMLLTAPLIVVFAAALAVSNVELLRHEKPRVQNLLGLGLSVLLLAGEWIGLRMMDSDFTGSEWEYRIHNTFQNVYATVFVYLECMLIGSVICGLRAAAHQPEMNQDYIIVLGCWFRKDGSLPPLLRGRVDRAISFWREQKETTGKEALLIPSGGQGRDESMPEGEAMRRYMVEQGIPEACIHAETASANTYQNMAFSKAIIDSINPEGNSVFATTSYHVFRSGVWASQAGLKAEGIGGKTRWWFWPNAFIRECVGLLQKRWKQEILFLLLLILFFGGLSMALY